MNELLDELSFEEELRKIYDVPGQNSLICNFDTQQEDKSELLDKLPIENELRKMYGVPGPDPVDSIMVSEDAYMEGICESLTRNALQRYWRTPTEFPLCPNEIADKPLIAYLNNLRKGAVITKNEYATYFIDEFALCNYNCLFVTSHTLNGMKRFSIMAITFEYGKYVHEGTTFFEERGAQKALTLAQGLKWEGEDGIDDYC